MYKSKKKNSKRRDNNNSWKGYNSSHMYAMQLAKDNKKKQNVFAKIAQNIKALGNKKTNARVTNK